MHWQIALSQLFEDIIFPRARPRTGFAKRTLPGRLERESTTRPESPQQERCVLQEQASFRQVMG